MPQHPCIVVVGSSNTDMVIKCRSFPQPGETILGGTFFLFPGGKGANQAVASARLGGNTTFIARVGNDIFGNQAVAQFEKEGIQTRFIVRDEANPSGVALITVDDKGENTIVVAPGSNGALMPGDLDNAAAAFQTMDILLLQLEIPMDTVVQAASRAAALHKKVILNPAPATVLPVEIFPSLYAITPNRSEAQALTGIAITDKASAHKAAEKLKEKGVAHVVITLGAEGAYLCNDSEALHIPAPVVTPVDTTAAGDIFNGALAVAVAEGQPMPSAIVFANRAAAIAVTKMGAQASAPYRTELTQTFI